MNISKLYVQFIDWYEAEFPGSRMWTCTSVVKFCVVMHIDYDTMMALSRFHKEMLSKYMSEFHGLDIKKMGATVFYDLSTRLTGTSDCSRHYRHAYLLWARAKIAVDSGIYEHLNQVVSIMMADNDMDGVQPIIKWHNELDYDFDELERQASLLSPEEKEIFAAGEETEVLQLIDKYIIFELDDFLNELFKKF